MGEALRELSFLKLKHGLELPSTVALVFFHKSFAFHAFHIVFLACARIESVVPCEFVALVIVIALSAVDIINVVQSRFDPSVAFPTVFP